MFSVEIYLCLGSCRVRECSLLKSIEVYEEVEFASISYAILNKYQEDVELAGISDAILNKY